MIPSVFQCHFHRIHGIFLLQDLKLLFAINLYIYRLLEWLSDHQREPSPKNCGCSVASKFLVGKNYLSDESLVNILMTTFMSLCCLITTGNQIMNKSNNTFKSEDALYFTNYLLLVLSQLWEPTFLHWAPTILSDTILPRSHKNGLDAFLTVVGRQGETAS